MELLTLIAILAGPAIGAKIAQRMEDQRQKRQEKIGILTELLRTSQGTARESPEHVSALNLIRLVFHGEKAVIDAYERYMRYLNDTPPEEQEIEGVALKGQERFLDLLDALASTLGYSFNKTDLEKSSYAPKGWQADSRAQRENMALQSALLRGERPLWVAVVSPPAQAEDSSTETPERP